MTFATPPWDLALFTALNQQLRAAPLDWLAPILSWSPLLFLAALTAAALAVARYGRSAVGPLITYLLLTTLLMGLGDMTCNMLKDAFGRVRPLNSVAQAWLRDDGQWRQRPADFVRTKSRGSSFPSAHATNSMIAGVMLALALHRRRASSVPLSPVSSPGVASQPTRSRPPLWPLLLPLGVGWSRIYLGKHYPTDVVAGWLLGLGLALAFSPLAGGLAARLPWNVRHQGAERSEAGSLEP